MPAVVTTQGLKIGQEQVIFLLQVTRYELDLAIWARAASQWHMSLMADVLLLLTWLMHHI